MQHFEVAFILYYFLVMLSLPAKLQIIFHLFSAILSPGGSDYFMKIKLYCLFGSIYCHSEIANMKTTLIILFFIIRLLLFIIYEAEGYWVFFFCLFVSLSISFTDPVGLRTILILTGKLNKHNFCHRWRTLIHTSVSL